MASSEVIMDTGSNIVRTQVSRENSRDDSKKTNHIQQDKHPDEQIQRQKEMVQLLRQDNLHPHSTGVPTIGIGGGRHLQRGPNSKPQDPGNINKVGPMRTQIRQITCLQLEKMHEFGIFQNTKGLHNLPSGRV